MQPNNEHADLKALILENQRLLAENNEILKKLHRSHVRGMWLKVVWIVFILIAPMILLYYYIAPFYSSLYSITGDSPAPGLQDVQELNKILKELQ